MKQRGFFSLLCGACLLWPAAAGAGGAGTSGAQALQLVKGARPAALAGAYAALAEDINAFGVNPAGLGQLEDLEAMFLHLNGIEGQATEWLAVAMPVEDLGTLGAQFMYRGQPPIDNYVDGEPTVEVKDMLFGISFARPVVPGLLAGFNAQLAVLTLGPKDASALSLDLGLQYALDEKARLGLAVRHLGTPVKFDQVEDPLPLTVVAGSSLVVADTGTHKLTGLLDLETVVPEENYLARLGAEYWFKGQLALRLGYAYSYQAFVGGLTAGVGFRFQVGNVNLGLDYALQPQTWEDNDFELENVLSLSARF